MSRTATLVAAAFLVVSPGQLEGQSSWNDLVDLFGEWRNFERPAFVDGVPDYTASAMAQQQQVLRAWKDRLWAFDVGDWPVE